MTRPRLCAACGKNPVAYVGRECCYACVPRVWKRPAVCKRCGSGTDYFTSGLCRRCHRSGPWVDSCLDCFAWGVTRHDKWLCQACRGWRRKYGAPSECPSCRRVVPLNDRGYCRLCCRIATVSGQHHRIVDVVGVNKEGQQFFFADLILKKRKPPADRPSPPCAIRPPSWPHGYPVTHRQLVLFDWPRDLTRARLDPPLSDLAAALERAVEDHGARHGWRKSLRITTARGIRVLLAVQDTPGAAITASDVGALSQLRNCTVQPVLEVLDAVGMLDDDRPPPLEGWFDSQANALADAIGAELRQWFYALRDGSSTPPRSRPRGIETVRQHVSAVVPALRSWSAAGHESLREITREEIVAVLPSDANRRRQALGSLRILFRFLKARRMVFVNPATRTRVEQPQPNYPMPIDLDVVRDALDIAEPARAALTALAAFHGLRSGQLRALQLTDVRDGRLHIENRAVVLAGPVRERLAAWLDERARRWPGTANPHLFVSHYTAVRTGPVSSVWITGTNRVPVRAIREDRILNEAIATGGDVRRISDLFGLTVAGAQRYVIPASPEPTVP